MDLLSYKMRNSTEKNQKYKEMDLLSYKMRNSTEKNRKSRTLIPFVPVSVLIIDPTMPLHYLPWSK